MNWLELSYAYIFAICDYKKMVRGTKKFLHPDAMDAYKFLEKVLERYHKYPTRQHFKQRYNLKYEKYALEGYSIKEIAELVKDEFIKYKLAETAKELQKLAVSDELLEIASLFKPIEGLYDSVSSVSSNKPVKLSQYKKNISHFLSRDGEVKVCDWGIPSLDEFTGGLFEQQYIII